MYLFFKELADCYCCRPAGKYECLKGCPLCPEGYFNDMIDSHSCYPCPIGTFTKYFLQFKFNLIESK
jgi:hypothetical protein